MEQESELQRLEKYVEKILTRFSALKEEKGQLEQDLFERDLLIEELRENISSKVTERNEISERVNRIVDQIEEWEQSLEKDEAVQADTPAETANAVDIKVSDVTEEPEIKRDSEEKPVQHDLFSMAGSRE